MNNIKNLLRQKGMKQRELAAMLQMGEGQLNKIILSHTIPGISIAFKIAKALEVSVDELFKN